MHRLVLAALFVAAHAPLSPALAQTPVFAIGDAPRVDGLRLNFRDRNLELVRGVNITIWTPYESADDSFRGDVRGMAIGLPATAARNIDGIAWGWLGAGAYESVRGIAAGGLGVGAGQDLVGIASGGLGVGAGEDLTGIAIGGLGVGVGAGESMTGIFNYARHLNGVQIGLLNWAGNSRAKLLPIVNAHFD